MCVCIVGGYLVFVIISLLYLLYSIDVVYSLLLPSFTSLINHVSLCSNSAVYVIHNHKYVQIIINHVFYENITIYFIMVFKYIFSLYIYHIVAFPKSEFVTLVLTNWSFLSSLKKND